MRGTSSTIRGTKTNVDSEEIVKFVGVANRELVVNLLRTQGDTLLLKEFGFIDEDLCEQALDVFNELRGRIVGIKGIVPTR